MEYRKEKNLLMAIDENGKCKGKYDWESATFYGVKGTQIKRMPAAFDCSVYGSIITSHQWIISHLTDQTLERALHRWECMASLGIYCTDHDVLIRVSEMPALKKDFVAFIKNNNNSEYSDNVYKLYLYSTTTPEYNLLNDSYRALVNNIIYHNSWYTPEFPMEWGIKAMFRLQCEDASYLLGRDNIIAVLNEYYQQCKGMEEECAITKNFMITIAHTKHLYQNYKLQAMSKLIAVHNDIPQLYYENDDFTVRPLRSREEFHEEATAQNNCVERIYMEYVANGSTHVVVVRRKNNPEQSYITCEIDNYGRIIQYLTRNNSHPTAPDAITFKRELQNYLSSLSWDKG